MKVSETMTVGVKTATPDTPVKELANIMCLNNISGLPVVDEQNKIVGVVSEKDLLKRMFPDMSDLAEGGKPDFEDMEKNYSNTLDLKASDIMTTNVAYVSSDMPIMKAATMMCARNIRRIPVVDKDDGKLVGIISIGDVHKAIYQEALTG